MNTRLLKFDRILLLKDPMLLLSIFTPVFLFLFIQFLFPLIAGLVLTYFSYDLNSWYFRVIAFFTPLIPMVFGMAYSFILLDEKDSGIITAFSVTPPGKRGYLLHRIGFPMIITFFSVAIFCIIFGIPGEGKIFRILIYSFFQTLNIPLIILFIGSFASNKVEGIALSKSFGILLAGIAIDFFATGTMTWLGAFSPLFWLERIFFAETSLHLAFYGIVSFIIYGGLIFFLRKKFDSST